MTLARSELLAQLAAIEAEERALKEAELAAIQAEERALLAEHAISRQPGWFWAFFQWAWPIVEPKRKLVELEANRVVCEDVEAVLEGRTQYLAVEVPPGFNKSMIANTMPTPATWLHRPWLRFFHCAGTAKVNTENSHRARLLMQSPEYIELADRAAALHGHEPWRLREGANRALDYENAPHRGQRFARPLKGDVTGVRADFLFLDDLMQASDFLDEPDRVEQRTEAVYQRMTNVLSTRLNDEERDPIMMIAQGLGPGDPGDRWRKDEPSLRLCKLPMEYDPHDPERHPRDWRKEPGELLAPAFRGREAVDRKRRMMTTQAFEAQFNQKRLPASGRMFNDAMLRRYDGAPRRELGPTVLMSVDCTFKDGRRTDEVALVVLAVDGHRRFVLEVLNAQADIVRTLEMGLELYRRWEPHTTLVEDKANGPAFIRLARDKIPGLLPFTPKDSKTARLAVFATAMRQAEADGRPWYWPENQHAPMWMPQVAKHLANAPHGKPVDIPDACAQAEIWLQANPWFGAPPPSGDGFW